ncbi:MAG: hypothetical protein NVSMB25_01010 [Thermoleophilaceae bacterium]
MAHDSLIRALDRLDPASRALLDLSLRRGLTAEEIAELLGADPNSVVRLRNDALMDIAQAIGIGEDEDRGRALAMLAELSDAQWGAGPAAGDPPANGSISAGTQPASEALRGHETQSGDSAAAAAVDPDVGAGGVELSRAPGAVAGTEAADRGSDADAGAEPRVEATDHAGAEQAAGANDHAGAEQAAGATDQAAQVAPEAAAAQFDRSADGARNDADRRRRAGVVAILALVVLGAIAAVALSSGGHSHSRRAASRVGPPPAGKPTATPAPAPAPGGAAKAVRLMPIGGASARATARPTGTAGAVIVTASGLRPAPKGYDVWLYNSVIDSSRVGRMSGSPASVTLTPPASGHFHFLDIARAPTRGSAHSGESVLRVSLSTLRPRR